MANKIVFKDNPGVNRKFKWKATFKQSEALSYLQDNITRELVWGGAAGGAKSYLGCAWCIVNTYKYPGCRGLIGRSVLKQLKQSTLLTFFEVCRHFGLKRDRDYVYNEMSGVISFPQTKSEIYLKDLFYYPSDPEYDSLGSTEYTYAFIDEASQIREKCKDVILSRLRYKHSEYNLIPKLLMTCNPAKNFLYTQFYKPWKEGTLLDDRKFIPAKVTDNPFLPASYIESLKRMDKPTQERLLHGNWEYEDDPNSLIEFDALTDLFTNSLPEEQPKTDASGNVLPDNRPRYIICDVARYGRDKTAITIWKGNVCVAIFTYAKTSIPSVAKLVREKMTKYNVPASNVLVDEDGIGGGVKDLIYGCKGFIANSRPFREENYRNLKAQCAYELARKINSREISAKIENSKIREEIIADLEQIKAKDLDKDGPKAIMSKDSVKERLGRSPDIGDTFVMRMFFEFKPKAKFSWIR